MNEWNTSAVNSLAQCFLSCTSFNQPIGNWNTGAVVSLSQTFYNCTSFNQPLPWNTANVTSLNETFRLATGFNQNISSWNIANVVNMNGFMQSKTNLNYSSANYDALLLGWSSQTVEPNLTPNFGTIKYTATGVPGRNILTGAPNNWVITDGGL